MLPGLNVAGLPGTDCRPSAGRGMVAQPFFCSPGTGERPTRRLLLLSYHFPPGEAVGALRWQKMARIAVERGWNLDVVTLAPSSLPSPNSDALGDLPPGLRLYGVPRPRLHRERLEHALWRLYDQVRPQAQVRGWPRTLRCADASHGRHHFRHPGVAMAMVQHGGLEACLLRLAGGCP